MKRRVRTQPNNPFYSNEPAVSRNKMADNPMSQNASLGNVPPKMVDKHPGKLSGVAGFVSKGKPSAGKGAQGVPTFGAKAKGTLSQGSLKSSGHPGAHRLGGIKNTKLKI